MKETQELFLRIFPVGGDKRSGQKTEPSQYTISFSKK